MLNTKLLITNKFYSYTVSDALPTDDGDGAGKSRKGGYVGYIYCTNMVSHAYY